MKKKVRAEVKVKDHSVKYACLIFIIVILGIVALVSMTQPKPVCPIQEERNSREVELEQAVLHAHRIILKDTSHVVTLSKLPIANSVKVICKFSDADPYEVFQDTGVGFETSSYRRGDKCEVEFQ